MEQFGAIIGAVFIAIVLLYVTYEFLSAATAMYSKKTAAHLEQLPWYTPPKFWADSAAYVNYWVRYWLLSAELAIT